MRRSTGLRLAVALASLASGLVVTGGAASAPASGWVPTLPLSQQSRQELSAFPDGTAYVFDVGSNTGITLWHSANHGLAWDPLTYLPAGISTFAQARFATPKAGYLIDFDRIFVTSNGATTATSWRQLPGPKMPKGRWWFADVLGVTGTTVAVGGGEGRLQGGSCTDPGVEDIWTSHDAARTWVAARLPNNTQVGSVRYLNARDGVALAWEMHLVSGGSQCSYAGDHNSVYVTHDGGRHFTLAAHCAHRPDELCTSALFLDPRHLLVGRNDGSLTTSADGGRTFREQAGLPTVLGPQPTSSSTDEWFWIQGFALSGQRVFATTKLAGAYLSDDAGRTWVREPSCDTGYTLGIGEVAAFDRERAIAGGPSCIATRTDGSATTGTAVWPTPPRVPSGDVDVTSSAAGVRAAVSGGRLLVTRLSGAGPKDTAAAS